jgi:hypothetical protein
MAETEAERQKFKELSELLAKEKEEERIIKERLDSELKEKMEKISEIESQLEEKKVDCDSIGVGSSQVLF